MLLKKSLIPNKNFKIVFGFLLLFLCGSVLQAQEIIKEDVAEKPVDLSVNQKRKIDGIIATVGDYIVLDSDIDKAFLEITAQGGSVSGITRCQMLGKLLEDKLYAHQAIQDSIIVTDAEVKGMMDQRLDYMMKQVGSIDKIVEYYKKGSVEEFKSYFFDILKEQQLSSQMQKKIVDEVEITPEEVRNFFKKIPKDELPQFGAEMEIAQIVAKPIVSQAEKQKVIDKLNEFKREVENGASFATKAVLYSKDPGSSSNGGYYKINRKTGFAKEFKDVAFSLQEGEVSAPFETDFGFHIIKVEKIKGQEVELRHILLVPSVSEDALNEAKERITLIRNKIINKEISFADAARTESDQKETRANGGTLINTDTQDTRFELTKMNPTMYTRISNLKDDEVSQPILDTDEKGEKSYVILTVTNRINEHTADYALDYVKIKDLALKEKQIDAIGKWFDEKIKETYIKIIGEYKECDFTNNWLKK
ncbi:peptidylprolyl isomerase [Flavobacterium agrisoli]|uniref:Peptidylprolyl isomerase n=1 Tax=Flavobacterium agrisoli TaxID=2793066 RepID=A0A934UKF4_9FLAO|nr:peptidylprolyl isomerase [Flavobacterium agrisoli]MBK0370484.1 peptidylprolyl isomerase [Flavobacterium agrisoli]